MRPHVQYAGRQPRECAERLRLTNPESSRAIVTSPKLPSRDLAGEATRPTAHDQCTDHGPALLTAIAEAEAVDERLSADARFGEIPGGYTLEVAVPAVAGNWCGR